MATPSPSPTRYPNGVSTEYPFKLLGNFGLPNRLSYHECVDDFNYIDTSHWTVSATGNGTVVSTAGKGGLALFTTNSSSPAATDMCEIQQPSATFTFVAGKKGFFATRMKVSDATNVGILAGLIQTTTSPFTVTDGLYFYKASGAANNLLLVSMIGSVETDLTIPTSAYTLANDTFLDLGWYLDRSGNVFAFVNSQLIGWLPQSGSSTTDERGPCASFAPSLTTANLNLTLTCKSGTTASKTMTADYIFAAMER